MRKGFRNHCLKDRLLMRQYRELGFKLEQIAECWEDLSVATLCRYLAELRKTYGPEVLPKRHSARWPAMQKHFSQLSDDPTVGQ